MGETILWRAIRWVAFGALGLLIAWNKRSKRGENSKEATEDEEQPSVEEAKGPMAWIHSAKFDLDL
jgi:hypothetical protein